MPAMARILLDLIHCPHKTGTGKHKTDKILPIKEKKHYLALADKTRKKIKEH